MIHATHPIEALLLWWGTRADLAALTADGKLHLVEAPEGTGLPYLTLLPVSEAETDRTTGYYYLDTVLQISAHAELPAAAASLRDAVGEGLGGIPIAINGSPVRHVLPGSQAGPMVGEGRGPDGVDCWMATVDVEIPWARPAPGAGPATP